MTGEAPSATDWHRRTGLGGSQMRPAQAPSGGKAGLDPGSDGLNRNRARDHAARPGRQPAGGRGVRSDQRCAGGAGHLGKGAPPVVLGSSSSALGHGPRATAAASFFS